jgi:hypothetical protein
VTSLRVPLPTSFIRESNVVLGGVAPTADQANAMMARGYKALVLGFDWSLLQRGIDSVLDGIRRPTCFRAVSRYQRRVLTGRIASSTPGSIRGAS